MTGFIRDLTQCKHAMSPCFRQQPYKQLFTPLKQSRLPINFSICLYYFKNIIQTRTNQHIMSSRSKLSPEYHTDFKSSDEESSRTLKPSRTGKSKYAQFISPSLYASFLLQNKRILMALVSLLIISLYTRAPFIPHYSFQKPKVVIILAANEGGGVQRWKTPQEWSVERSSIANKKDYANRHGYELAIKDSTMKRRYSHEWREGWEKADILKQTMRQYPDAEWFWWLDLHTFIMEPQISLEEYLFDHLESKVYRTLDYLNPLNLPVDSPYVNVENSPVDLILAQDCGGFNLGSFLIRRSPWTELLLDLWWDPSLYEQMHMTWEHKEQDCLETLYQNQPWIREHIGFVPLRAINSFPPGACSDQRDDPQYFYNEKDRDFVVNMAGCNFGDRSCWNEYEHYRNLQKRLSGKRWYKFW